MDWFLFYRILEKLLIIYFLGYLTLDILLFFYSLYSYLFPKKKSVNNESFAYQDHSISIVVPGYNEEITIAFCLQKLLNLDYPDYNVIFINDGSTDTTLQQVLDKFDLEKIDSKDYPSHWNNIPCAQVQETYETKDKRLLVINKANGGKADSVNTGINFSEKKYICTVDADSILDSTSLKSVIKPFILNPKTFVSGGQLAAANGIKVEDNQIISNKLPSNPWVVWQIIEYLKSFMVSKIGLSKIDSLLIMSGAFSIYRKDDLLKVGGFLAKTNDSPYIVESIGAGKHTVCEDMEIVVRLWRYFKENKIPAKAEFMPNPVCWTEVPDNPSFLWRQRGRWHLGLIETLWMHRSMIFEPKYGMVGLFALPYYLFFEFLNPVIKILAIILVTTASILGWINPSFILFMTIGFILFTTIITSITTVLIENWSKAQKGSNRAALRYKSVFEWLYLLLMGIIGDFTYGLFKTFAQTKGIIDFLRKKSEWNKFARKGFDTNN